MHMLTRIVDIIDSFNNRIGEWVSYLVIPLTAIVFLSVIMRYIFHRPLSWGFEVSGLSLSAYTILIGAYCLLKDSHVRLGTIFDRLSPKKQATLDIITSILFFIFIAAFMFAAVRYALLSVTAMETTESGTGIPIWPVKLLMPIGGGLLALQGISKLIRNILLIYTKGRAS
jgi:TRAP-type mannitol/chloroaromatic compound transport system permease small subunit